MAVYDIDCLIEDIDWLVWDFDSLNEDIDSSGGYWVVYKPLIDFDVKLFGKKNFGL